MDNSPLRALPTEIRDYIYELSLQEESPIRVFTGGREGRKSGFRLWFHHPNLDTEKPGLLMACKEIRAESLGVYYGCISFDVSLEKLGVRCRTFKLKRKHSIKPLQVFMQASLPILRPHYSPKIVATCFFAIGSKTFYSELPGLIKDCTALMKSSCTRCAVRIEVIIYQGGSALSNEHMRPRIEVDCMNLKESLPTMAEVLAMKATMVQVRYRGKVERASKFVRSLAEKEDHDAVESVVSWGWTELFDTYRLRK